MTPAIRPGVGSGNFWLLKTEPRTWSWDDQLARGEAGEPWDGVRNFEARGHMARMRPGDAAFFYHTGAERRIMGTVRVVRLPYPDPADPAGRFLATDVTALETAPRTPTLADLRAVPSLADMTLLQRPRLSVQPVTPRAWAIVRVMAGLDPDHGDAHDATTPDGCDAVIGRRGT